ncbi:hypothetical protein [Paraburkholderia sediminicola]
MTPDINSASKINGGGVKKMALRQNNNVGDATPSAVDAYSQGNEHRSEVK